jgi:folate-binding protein YgfZ
MDAELYQNLIAEGGFVDLSARAKWRLSGADRVRYLNGQVTNDVRLVKPDAAMHACVTNLKGRIEGDVFIHADGDGLIIDAPEGLREILGNRLERYIIADDAVLEDITDEWCLWHFFGTEPETGRKVQSQRFGIPGWDVWLPVSECPESRHRLSAADAEAFRILQRVPAYPGELNADTFPQEAGLEKTTMSYTKGCYIGQEILSRIKTTGKMPRELIAWTAAEREAEISAGASLFAGEKSIGTITSLTRHPLSGLLAGMGYIRQGAAAVDSMLLVGDGVSNVGPVIKISALLNQ